MGQLAVSILKHIPSHTSPHFCHPFPAPGRIIYHGPVNEVLPFFQTLGFDCPQRKDLPSFLLEVTTPAGQYQYASRALRAGRAASMPDSLAARASGAFELAFERAVADSNQKARRSSVGGRDSVEGRSAHGAAHGAGAAAGQTGTGVHHEQEEAGGGDGRGGGGDVKPDAQMLAAAMASVAGAAVGAAAPRALLVPIEEMESRFWRENPHGVRMLAELAAPSDPRARDGAGLLHKPYALSPWEVVWVATKRQMILLLRDRVLLRGRMGQTVILSLISGSLFYQLPITLTGARSFFGASFM